MTYEMLDPYEAACLRADEAEAEVKRLRDQLAIAAVALGRIADMLPNAGSMETQPVGIARSALLRMRA